MINIAIIQRDIRVTVINSNITRVIKIWLIGNNRYAGFYAKTVLWLVYDMCSLKWYCYMMCYMYKSSITILVSTLDLNVSHIVGIQNWILLFIGRSLIYWSPHNHPGIRLSEVSSVQKNDSENQRHIFLSNYFVVSWFCWKWLSKRVWLYFWWRSWPRLSVSRYM